MTNFLSALKLASFAVIPMQGRVHDLYNTLGDHNSLCREKNYLNLGYWGYGAQNLDQAGEDLAELLAKTADLRPQDRVLDVGCGFCDQDIFWANKYKASEITAANLSQMQIEGARKNIAQHGLSERIKVIEANAVNLPIDEESFDVVFALESAFHFDTRKDFFREAFRVLKPGGRLVMADLCAVDKKLSFKDRVAESIGRSFWQIPKPNMYDLSQYLQYLRECGFQNVEGQSIWKDVYLPFAKFARKRLDDSEIQKRLNPAFRRMLKMSLRARQNLEPKAMDYVLVQARK